MVALVLVFRDGSSWIVELWLILLLSSALKSKTFQILDAGIRCVVYWFCDASSKSSILGSGYEGSNVESKERGQNHPSQDGLLKPEGSDYSHLNCEFVE